MKIISLVPSITELLVDLGLEENIVGITKFCIHPKRLKSEKNILGGTKNIHVEKIKDLNVDLIIANKEENQKEQIETLLLTENVWVTEIYSLEDNWEFILELGKKTNRFKKAQQMVAEGIKKWNTVKDLFSKKKFYILFGRIRI